MRKQTERILSVVVVILSILAIVYLGGIFSVLNFQGASPNILTTNWWSGGTYGSVNGAGSQFWEPINCDYNKYSCQPQKSDEFQIYDKSIKIMGTCDGRGAFDYYFKVNNQFSSTVLNPGGGLASNGMSPVSVSVGKKKVYIYDSSACTEGNNCRTDITRLVINPCLNWYNGGNHVETYSYEFKQDKLLLNFTDVKPVYIQGENLTISYDITNNFGDVIMNICGKLAINSLFSSDKDYCTGKVTVPTGKTNYKIVIPISDVNPNSFTVTPHALVWSAPGKIQNANLYSYDDNGNFQGVSSGTTQASVKLGEFSAPSQNFSINLKPLQLGKNQLVAMETFAGGTTLSKTSTRYQVVAFSSVLPVIIVDGTSNSVKTDKSIYNDLDAGKTIVVPSNQVYSLFYVINNNYQLPTICDVLDVKTNTCAKVNPGIVIACSQGQLDSSTGLCVVQGQSKTVCNVGTLDLTTNKCIYFPPIAYQCPNDGKNWVYNINSGKCEYSAPTSNVCTTGTYNSQTNTCQIFPTKQIICPPNYAYDSASDKCISYPNSAIICQVGFTFNKNTAVCEMTPPSTLVCPINSKLNTATNLCEITPATQVVCPSGSYDSSKQACIVTPPTSNVCSTGILTTMNGNPVCLYSPSTIANCPSGTTYNSEKDICSYNPAINNVCSVGIFNSNTNTCDVAIQVTCPQGTYNSDVKACVYNPNLQYLCSVGTLTKNETGAFCSITPETKIICPDGATYDKDKNMCVGTVDYMKDLTTWDIKLVLIIVAVSVILILLITLRIILRRK